MIRSDRPSSPLSPALFFEPDGYMLDGPKLMGRQAAGHAFLRALIDAATVVGVETLTAYTPHATSAQVFEKVVKQQAPTLQTNWLPAHRIDLLAQQRALFLPGPGLGDAARLRLRAGPAAWSITGVTHTLCSHIAMDALVDLIAGPTMPWDALICTSRVAKQTVETLLQLQAQYFAWRFGVKTFTVPQLPIIPLGVHAKDFFFSESDRQQARQALGLENQEVAVLFAGRLSFHAKAHPYPMMRALEEAAGQTGQRLRLLLCGQFPNDAVKGAFLEGARRHCPSVKTHWIDGKLSETYRHAWVGSDIFVSLSDNLQETFGITPLEAMASGLPVLVSDWDGYKDTIVDGQTGFRIPTHMPPPDLGMALASAFEAGSINYDRYIGLACLEVSVEFGALVDRLVQLVNSPTLRQTMGQAGRSRVEQLYDWPVVIGQYQQLWQELEAIRIKAIKDPHPALQGHPACATARQDPYRVFAHFPTHVIAASTSVTTTADEWTHSRWNALMDDALFSYAKGFLPETDQVLALNARLRTRPGQTATVAELGQGLGWPIDQTIKTVAFLAKLGVITLNSNPGSP